MAYSNTSPFFIQPGMDTGGGIAEIGDAILQARERKKRDEMIADQLARDEQFRQGAADYFAPLQGVQQPEAENPAEQAGEAGEEYIPQISHDNDINHIVDPRNAKFEKMAFDEMGITDDKLPEIESFAEQYKAAPDEASKKALIRERINAVVDRGGDASHTAQLLTMPPEQADKTVEVVDAMAKRAAIRKMMLADPEKASRMLSEWQAKKKEETDLKTRLSQFENWKAMPPGEEKDAFGMIIGAVPKTMGFDEKLQLEKEKSGLATEEFRKKQDIRMSTDPEIESAISKAREGGKNVATDLQYYSDINSKLPALYEITNKLRDLSKAATYTGTGKAYNVVRKELGFAPTEGATARASYIATVNNEILPLLRDTFGAAFTQKEGESLKATLGDPDSTPAEKQAQLDAFIESKTRQVRLLGDKLGKPAPKSPTIDVTTASDDDLLNGL